jgi:alanine racemase
MSNHTDIPKRCVSRINLSSIQDNVAALREIWGVDRNLMGIVKADAYGHGIEAIAETLLPHVEMFGVAGFAEAGKLKRSLDDSCKDIFLLSAVLQGEREAVAEEGLIIPVSNLEEAAAFDSIAAEKKNRARIHVVIDTGMGRIGAGEEEFDDLLKGLLTFDHLSIEGLASHFPVADDEDQTYTLDQIERFEVAAERFKNVFPEATHIHIANSAGLLKFAEHLDFTTLARPGLALYGVAPGGFGQEKLVPALTLKTEIALIREMKPGQSISYGRTFFTSREPMKKVAILAAGYGDGYPRHLSNMGTQVLVGGQRCPLLGTVTMDQIMVDISELNPTAELGDEAILIGSQGEEEIAVSEIAEKAGTIPWEIFTGITQRVGREYS